MPPITQRTHGPLIALSTDFIRVKEYFEAIVASSGDLICTTDITGRIIYFSPGAEAMLGLTVRDLDRQTADRLDLPAAVKGVLITRVEAMSSGFDGRIERGALLLEINRQRVETVAEYRRIAQSVRPGDILTFYLYSPDIDQRQLKTVRVEDR